MFQIIIFYKIFRLIISIESYIYFLYLLVASWALNIHEVGVGVLDQALQLNKPDFKQ